MLHLKLSLSKFSWELDWRDSGQGPKADFCDDGDESGSITTRNFFDSWKAVFVLTYYSIHPFHTEISAWGRVFLPLKYAVTGGIWKHERKTNTTEGDIYEGVSKSFRTGRLERELQMVQLSSTRCSFISSSWVSPVSFAAITLCVAFQRVLIIVIVVYFVIDSVWKVLNAPSYR
jgi:hypothetical protein